jgi:hypothetical protein
MCASELHITLKVYFHSAGPRILEGYRGLLQFLQTNTITTLNSTTTASHRVPSNSLFTADDSSLLFCHTVSAGG